MKLTIGKRIVMFFHWLFSLLICAVFAVYLIKPEFVLDLYGQVTAGLGKTQIMVIGIAILALYVILAIAEAWIVFHRGKREDRGFITVDSSDTGRVRISVPAIEQMVRQAVNGIDGITDMKIGIVNLDDAINIDITSTIVNGSHVPTITMNMQRAIRQFVEMNCGVAVRAVSININSVAEATEGQKRKWGMRRADKRAAETPVIQPIEPAPAYAPAKEPEPMPAYVPPITDDASGQSNEVQTDASAAYDAYSSDLSKMDEVEVRPITLTLDPPSAGSFDGQISDSSPKSIEEDPEYIDHD